MVKRKKKEGETPLPWMMMMMMMMINDDDDDGSFSVGEMGLSGRYLRGIGVPDYHQVSASEGHNNE